MDSVMGVGGITKPVNEPKTDSIIAKILCFGKSFACFIRCQGAILYDFSKLHLKWGVSPQIDRGHSIG